MRKISVVRRFFLLAFFISALSAAAEEEPLPSVEELPAFHEWIDNISSLLGATLEDAFQSFGIPVRVSSARGDEAWQDDVVFEYEEGFSLFWYKDRVWQLRFGPGFTVKSRDAGMGSSRGEIVALLGKPFHAEDDWVIYHFAGNGYPLRIRLFFGEGGLEDIYIYRSDF